MGETKVEEFGRWGRDRSTFECILSSIPHPARRLIITERPVGVLVATPDEQLERKQILKQAVPQLVTAQFPGFGYLYGSEADGPNAIWICNGRELMVETVGMASTRGELRYDTKNLLVSMLPWMCGPVPVPTAEGAP